MTCGVVKARFPSCRISTIVYRTVFLAANHFKLRDWIFPHKGMLRWMIKVRILHPATKKELGSPREMGTSRYYLNVVEFPNVLENLHVNINR